MTSLSDPIGQRAGPVTTHRRKSALGLLAAGLLGLATGARAEAPVETIRIAVVSGYTGGQMHFSGIDAVIDQQGWLRQELSRRGIKLEWYPAPNAAVGPIINEAFSNHVIQFASYSDLPSIILNGRGSQVATRLLVPSAPNDSYLVVPAASTARSIDDLKGKRLAVDKGRPWEIALLRLLDSKGLSYKDFQLFNINPEVSNVALATRSIDAAVTPQAYALQEKGIARIIWSTKDEPLDWKSWGGFWGADDFVRQHPDIARLVVTAYVKAAYWASQPEHRADIIALGTRNGTPASVVAHTYDDPHISWKDHWSPLFQPALYDHYRADIAYALDKKIIPRKIDVDALLDPEFARAAVSDLGLDGYWRLPDDRQAPAGQ